MFGRVLLVAGALLLTPVFFTDLLGFVYLTPRLRQLLIRRWLASRMVAPAGRSTDRGKTDVVEGEFRRVDD